MVKCDRAAEACECWRAGFAVGACLAGLATGGVFLLLASF
jgi:hypothetical protein